MKKLSKKLLLSGLAALTIYSGFNTIDISTTYAKVNYDVFDLEAHRGGRDIRPENTLYSYAYAIELGATSIECDMQLTKDGQIVMSHNPILNSDITRDENGNYIENNKYDIRLMTVDELKKFDVGVMDPNCGEYYDLHGKTQFTYDAKIPTLEELLQELGCEGNAFDSTGEFTKAGEKAYDRLEHLLYDIERLTGKEVTPIIRELDKIRNENY